MLVPDHENGLSIGQYLIRRLYDYGIRDVFGLPGDYVLTLYTQLAQSKLNVVGCTREDCAGFAADAYARIHGMGALCITYCVGGLSVCNSIAGAYAEKSPVVVISGSPGLRERLNNPLLHHKVRDFRTQVDVFNQLCVATAELSDPVTAFREVEESDCLLLLGTFMTDINLGIFTANLDPDRCIYVTSEQLRIRHHHFHQVQLREYVQGLIRQPPRRAARPIPSHLHPPRPVFELQAAAPITIERLFARLNEQLDEQTIVIADIGDALFGATELQIRGRTEFLSPAYYASMGFAVPAAVGAHFARPAARVVVVCGDGAFQALQTAWQDRTGPSLLHVHINPQDHSRALQRLAERLKARV